MKSIGRLVVILAAIGASSAPFREVSAQALTPTAYFAHVPVGGGFTTTFTFLNTGSSLLTGNLILTLKKSDQTPVNITVTDLSLNQSTTGSGSPITIPISGIKAGGTLFLSVASTSPNDSTAVGWARVESTGGTLGGVATFAYSVANQLQTIAGVLSADLTSVATIPVDDDVSQNRFTGYAVANAGSAPIIIKVVEVPSDGNAVNAVSLADISLTAGEQRAVFFFQDPKAAQKFQGSAVLIGQTGATFSVVALVQVQGVTGPLYTAIPVIPAKAPSIN